jgi:hypothetical protein
VVEGIFERLWNGLFVHWRCEHHVIVDQNQLSECLNKTLKTFFYFIWPLFPYSPTSCVSTWKLGPNEENLDCVLLFWAQKLRSKFLKEFANKIYGDFHLDILVSFVLFFTRCKLYNHTCKLPIKFRNTRFVTKTNHNNELIEIYGSTLVNLA